MRIGVGRLKSKSASTTLQAVAECRVQLIFPVVIPIHMARLHLYNAGGMPRTSLAAVLGSPDCAQQSGSAAKSLAIQKLKCVQRRIGDVESYANRFSCQSFQIRVPFP